MTKEERTLRRGPLHGIRVVDAATTRAELAGRILADLGAEVVKVEPSCGAGARRLGPFERASEGDPEASLYWASVALGKRSVVLDLDHARDRELLRVLLATADVFLESFDPGTLDALGLGAETLRAANTALVHASVTPFGSSGPLAREPATDLTLEAAGGLLGLQGDGDRPPIALALPQASFHAGAQAAADVVIALCERERSGCGQHLDVSMQAAVVWTLMNATGYPPMTGANPPHFCERRNHPPFELVPGLALPRLTACADGYALLGIGLPGMGERTLHELVGWTEAGGELPRDLCAIDWNHWIRDALEGRRSVDDVRRASAALCAFLLAKTKDEVRAFALERAIILAPINDLGDVAADPQLAARAYWTYVDGRRHPGAFARLSATPIQLAAGAPKLGEHQGLLAEPRSRPDLRGSPEATRAGGLRVADSRAGAFAGLRVADFAWVGVGPLISKALADHGATVVHIESEQRLDVLRLLPPFKDAQPGINRAHFHANFNTSKLGLTLNLATDGGRALARRLALWADVVVESFTPGTMRKLGLDWDTLGPERPDLVMLSTCLRGQTGPECTYTGFGHQGAALAGLYALVGWPDRPPAGPWGAYTDFIAPRYGVATLASALYHRARTGRGQHVDLSQVEAAIHFLEPLALDYSVNGRVARARGADSPYACPHGAYPAAGVERYVAIAVESPAQWTALRRLAPLEEFAAEVFEDPDVRRAHRGAIDGKLCAWSRGQEPFELAARLRSEGVPAYVVLWPSDLYHDPQLAHRGFFVTLPHPVMGPTPVDGPATDFSRTPARPRSPGPTLGEHTHEVLRDLLGLSDDEIADYAAAGALS